ncbi:MAG: amidase, partial [Chloroflexi bacterium]|nr:amidase [Chloroflexota bacterium]
MTYDLRDLNAPVLRGASLQALVLTLESPLGAPLAGHTFRLMDVPRFRAAAVDDAPLFQPAPPAHAEPVPRPHEALAAWAQSLQDAGVPSRILDYHRAYQEGRWDPRSAADAFLRAWAASEQEAPALRAFTAVHPDDLRAQAEAAAQRWRAGQPLSVLDGVPIAVKDETAVRGYATTWGIRAREDRVAEQDATVVARLRALGALIVGKTNMHEGGIGVTGHNVHYGTARNPYAPEHYPGGSSSGSAVAVVAGLVPAALGGDAGGSIRVPAAFSGGVGLKPTFGRVSRHSSEPLDWSVAHLG